MILIELLVLGWPIGYAARRTEMRARDLAVAGTARKDLPGERRVSELIVGGVELDLVHVQPDARPLRVLGGTDMALFGKRGGCRHRRRCAQHEPPRNRFRATAPGGAAVEVHGIPLIEAPKNITPAPARVHPSGTGPHQPGR